jgi:heme ABC exporter ATP-binding subunit CcmA
MTGRFPALAGVDLRVDEGEAVVLTGPNGAGKTSLLRVCAGLLRVTSGTAVVLGHDLVDDASAARREVAMLGHTAALYDDLSVSENVRFAVRAAGGDPRLVEGALDRLGLSGRLSKSHVGRLSAGQRKRVALAVVVARRARLWLLDEPHAALDAAARNELARLVKDAVADGVTVISASHEPDASMEIATRAVALAGGRVVSDVSGANRAPGGDMAGTAFGGDHPAFGDDDPALDHDPALEGDEAVVVAFRGGPNVA